MFKYRPYSHVHAWLHSTALPQRKLPIIFCITPHSSPTYSPLTFSRTLFHLMETVTLLLSTVWIIVIDKLIEREMFQRTSQKTLFWVTVKSCSTLNFYVSSHAFSSPAFETWKWYSPNCLFSKNILDPGAKTLLILLSTERPWRPDFL